MPKDLLDGILEYKEKIWIGAAWAPYPYCFTVSFGPGGYQGMITVDLKGAHLIGVHLTVVSQRDIRRNREGGRSVDDIWVNETCKLPG
jgi:hypothetical protein